MDRCRVIYILFFVVFVAASTQDSQGCRYNVRETGFVDLGLERFHLYCFVDSQIPPEDLSRFQTFAGELLSGSAISADVISVDDTPDHPALRYRRSENGASGASLVLVSPSGQSLPLGSPGRDDLSLDEVRTSLLEAASSPIRSRLADELASAFGVVLLVEGRDEAQNRAARKEVHLAIQAVESELEFFPKPIERGPVLITLSRSDLRAEKLLLWSLHLRPEEIDQPVAVVLYGKGRWIGPAMIGTEISHDLLSRVLFVVGADCECGLDPRMMRGTLLPIPWNRERQARISKQLGFDPDNPLVRTEVAQILSLHDALRLDGRIEGDRLTELSLPPVEARTTGSPAWSRLFYLLGGTTALIFVVGALLLIRNGRKTP